MASVRDWLTFAHISQRGRIMNRDTNRLTRRMVLGQLSAGIAAGMLHAGEQAPNSGSSATGSDAFHIRALDRKYDLHREKGCTLLAIEVARWPGNEFGLWLPETIYFGG